MEQLPEGSRPPLFSPREWGQIVTALELPPRQAEILELLLNGYSDQEMAERLSIELPTIRTHFGRMFDRFHVRDRTALVVALFQAWRDLEEGPFDTRASRPQGMA